MTNAIPVKTKNFKFLEVVDYCDIPKAGPKQWVWSGLVPKTEITTIFGLPGTGKSALALNLAVHLACGMDSFLGEPPCVRSHTCFVAGR
jgi:hypothetical protein